MRSFLVSREYGADGCDEVRVVGEIGSNHNRDLEVARRLIDEAARCGLDAIKFQTLYPDDFISGRTTTAEYGMSQHYTEDRWMDVLKNHLILPFEWYEELVARVRRHGLAFVTTVHSHRSLEFALQHSPDAIKVASMDLTNTPLLTCIARAGLPVLLSLGMGGWADLERAVSTLEENGCRELVLMHCVSLYPPDPQALNLRFIDTLRRAFLKTVGFSDHSVGTASSVAAVVMGARVIERHFTLDRNARGPDHAFSLEPPELARLVRDVREALLALGSTRHEFSDAERSNALRYRRSLVANGDLSAGQVLTRENVALKRPGHGIQPYELENVTGRRVKQDVADGEVLTWDIIC